MLKLEQLLKNKFPNAMRYSQPEDFRKMKCLKCEKELFFMAPEMPNNVEDGGDLDVTFHYGSRYDMCIGMPNRKSHFGNEVPIYKLLGCDRIKAYICDDCFEKHIDLFEGFNIETKTNLKKVV